MVSINVSFTCNKVCNFSVECSTANFTIESPGYGYVHHYGIYEKLDLLEFSKTQPPTQFCFTSDNALLNVEAGKCIGFITRTNLQLVLLVDACDGPSPQQWLYYSDNQRLLDLTVTLCMSSWYYSLPPPDVQFVPGLSPCAGWNKIILNPSKFFTSCSCMERALNTTIRRS